MGGYMQKPGGATLVQQQTAGSADPIAPGKRTLIEQLYGATSGQPVVQHAPAHTPGGTHAADPTSRFEIAPAAPGIDKTGFIDNSNGAPIYNRPAESGGATVRDAPLPPAT